MEEVITIKIKYGSEFQKESWSEALRVSITALGAAMAGKHKGNELKIISGEELSKLREDKE